MIQAMVMLVVRIARARSVSVIFVDHFLEGGEQAKDGVAELFTVLGGVELFGDGFGFGHGVSFCWMSVRRHVRPPGW